MDETHPAAASGAQPYYRGAGGFAGEKRECRIDEGEHDSTGGTRASTGVGKSG